MNTRPITVSFVVRVDGKVVFKDLSLEWVESDDADAIGENIKEAISNIE